jgi:hypothetical protein
MMHDDAIRAAIKAMAPDRIQGFGYGTEGSSVRADPPVFVVRDVWRKPDEQELWRGSALTEEDREAFEERCEMERMRLGIEAYLAALK